MADQFQNSKNLDEKSPSPTDVNLSPRELSLYKSPPLPPPLAPPTPANAPQTVAEESPLADIFRNGASFVKLSPIKERYKAALVEGKRLSPSEFLALNNSESVESVKPFSLPQARDSDSTCVFVSPQTLESKGGYAANLLVGAITHVGWNEPHAFRALQVDAGFQLTMPFENLLGCALRSTKVHKKTKETVEKSIAKYVVHGFGYPYPRYSPAAAERDVLTATVGRDRSELMKKWAASMSEWAEGHKTAYGSLIETRKKAFHGIISDAVYKRINNLKNAHLSVFYKKLKNEAQEQLSFWLMLDKYPQYH